MVQPQWKTDEKPKHCRVQPSASGDTPKRTESRSPRDPCTATLTAARLTTAPSGAATPPPTEGQVGKDHTGGPYRGTLFGPKKEAAPTQGTGGRWRTRSSAAQAGHPKTHTAGL